MQVLIPKGGEMRKMTQWNIYPAEDIPVNGFLESGYPVQQGLDVGLGRFDIKVSWLNDDIRSNLDSASAPFAGSFSHISFELKLFSFDSLSVCRTSLLWKGSESLNFLLIRSKSFPALFLNLDSNIPRSSIYSLIFSVWTTIDFLFYLVSSTLMIDNTGFTARLGSYPFSAFFSFSKILYIICYYWITNNC